MERKLAGAAAILVGLLLVPAWAPASTVETRVVSRVDASDIARQMIAQVRGIEIGSSSATVTVEAEGGTRPMSVSLGDDPRGAAPIGDDAFSGLLRLAALPFVVGSLVRLLHFLARLGGM